MTELYVHFKWVNFKECEFFLKKKKKKISPSSVVKESIRVYLWVYIQMEKDQTEG